MEKSIAIVEKNAIEEVHVDLSEFHGHDLIDIRIWANYDSADKPKRPTKKGVTLALTKLPELIAALQWAESEARAAALLPNQDRAA
jgi:hypothetical protein